MIEQPRDRATADRIAHASEQLKREKIAEFTKAARALNLPANTIQLPTGGIVLDPQGCQ